MFEWTKLNSHNTSQNHVLYVHRMNKTSEILEPLKVNFYASKIQKSILFA